MEKTLYKKNARMFKGNPIGFVLCWICILVFGIPFIVALFSASGTTGQTEVLSIFGPLAGFPIVILLIWWMRCLGTVLIITDKRTILQQGILSKNTNDVLHSDIRNLQIKQGPLARITGVAKICISSAGHAGIEIEIGAMPEIHRIRAIFDDIRVEEVYKA